MTLQQLKYVTAIADCGSMNEAAKTLFVSQPSLSGAVKELEEEAGIEIFKRTNKGVLPTPEGEEFLGYARQLLNQYELLEDRFIRRTRVKKKFSVSMQHYSFAVKAFVELVKQYGMDEYEFAVYETKTGEVISNVRNFRSEIGVLYENEFNGQAISKILKENNVSANLTDVLAIVTSSCAGSFANTLSYFTKAGISIEYMYCFSIREKAILILRTNNRESAREVIRRQNLEYICESDLIKL